MSVFDLFNDYLNGDSNTISSTNIMLVVSMASIHSLLDTFAPYTPNSSWTRTPLASRGLSTTSSWSSLTSPSAEAI